MLNQKRLENIKLVVSDVDGTLVNSNGEVGEKTIQLIKELRVYDVNFSLASGRLHSAIMPVAEKLNLKCPIISLDGAMIKRPNGRIAIHEVFLKQKHVEKAIELSENLLVNVALCHSDAIYYTESNSLISRLMDKFGAAYKEVDSYEDLTSETLEIAFAGDNKKSVEFLRDKFSFPFSFGCSVSFFRSQTQDNIYYLEIRKAGSSKGKAFKRLLNYMNIKAQNSAVLGDWYNDISLFKTKALKVCVKNAVDELKHLSDHVLSKTNNEDGVSEFLEALLKAKKNYYASRK